MIQLNQRLLSPDQVKEIREWAKMPAARHFCEMLAGQSAANVAEGGNLMLEFLESQSEASKLDSEDRLELARVLNAAIDLLQKAATMEDKDFTSTTLSPKTLTTPE